ncbi:hypothetical protein BJX63DRAFT_437773 [Aspergillus granulosus]|uniref:Beta-xylosidase C-terminal Concanavalin A-like domain-containing protein n=1 Tax=Aspergillus granulosus TaxID=176169 RepID=A0ABR4GU01_9EURO
MSIPTPLRPHLDLVWIRDPDLDCYELIENGRVNQIIPFTRDIHDRVGPISFVGKRQRTLKGQETVVLRTAPHPLFAAKGVIAGLAYYKDEHRYARVVFDYTMSTIFVETKKAGEAAIIRVRTEGLTQEANIHFCIKHTETSLEFGYSARDLFRNGWNFIGTMDTLDLTDRDFTGPCIGVFSTARGAEMSDGVSVTLLDFSVNT